MPTHHSAPTPRPRASTTRLAIASLATLATLQGCTSSTSIQSDQPSAQTSTPTADHDLPELRALYEADQADRTPGTAPQDWHKVEERDQSRQARVQALLEAGAAKTARDYYHAAMVFQHASTPEGIQLAHELAMIAACLGGGGGERGEDDKNARWLAAATYDRFLMYLERPQRFATQYRSSPDGVMKLYNTAPGVSDAMRAALNVPSLAQAQAREQEMQAQIEALRKATSPTNEKK